MIRLFRRWTRYLCRAGRDLGQGRREKEGVREDGRWKEFDDMSS